MSWIDSENREEMSTCATLAALETVLKNHDYRITKTSFNISATHGGTWSTNGKISNITITDNGQYRHCIDIETAKGYMCSPHRGILATIIQEAEKIEVQQPSPSVIAHDAQNLDTFSARVTKLRIMRENGIITEAEFEQYKAAMLKEI